MVTGKEPVVSETPPGETQKPPTPTAEEQLKSLQAEMARLQGELKERQQLADGYKGLQREINKKDAELKRASDLHSRLDNLEETQKIYAALMAEKLGENLEGDETPRKQDLLKKFDEVAAKQKQARIEVEARAKQEEYFRRADEVYREAETVYGDDVDSLANVRSLIRQGDFDLVEKKINKAKAKTQPPPAKAESEEEKINRLVEERLAQKIKDNPLLRTETATAMGRVGSREEIIARYGRGEATEDDYLRAINQK